MEKRNEFLNANEDVVSKVLENQPDDEYLYDLADLFKTFGDSTRIKILYALFEGELCVGDLATILQHKKDIRFVITHYFIRYLFYLYNITKSGTDSFLWLLWKKQKNL